MFQDSREDWGHLERCRLVSMLEMAAEAEKLHRFLQAENVYKRALSVARTTYGERSCQTLAILWDIHRVGGIGKAYAPNSQDSQQTTQEYEEQMCMMQRNRPLSSS